MKKILFLCLLLSYYSGVNAIALTNLPDDFAPHCFEYISNISTSEFEMGEVYKLNTDRSDDLVIAQGDILLPYKFYSYDGDSSQYETSLGYDIATLMDGNPKTSVEFDTIDKEIVITLTEPLKAGTFDLKMKSNIANNPRFNILVSDDGQQYSEISGSIFNISKYDISSLKIVYDSEKYQRDVFTIGELDFIQRHNTYLFRPSENIDISLYAQYNCKLGSAPVDNQPWTFGTDIDTQTLSARLSKNPSYSPQTFLDSDGDGIDNGYDNCRSVYNPDQLDSDGNKTGDACSDDDKDGVIGHKDNCINVSNKDQQDANRNGVGDVCEFDKDSDGVFDTLDNCITTPNPGQEDDDKDSIGNSCDNCEYYNPRQLDKNANDIGDVCDQKIKYLLENDDDKDGIENSKDNCKNTANPDQGDSDKDGIGDVCDNCRDIQNRNQLDLASNGIGDICEDSDSDGILGLEDNCINTPNADQTDSNNNGIGDVCEDNDVDKILFLEDNCPYDYNPDQSDLDKDNIGDVCDDNDDRYIESNKTFFIIIAVLIALIFLGGIGFMLHKLNTK